MLNKKTFLNKFSRKKFFNFFFSFILTFTILSFIFFNFAPQIAYLSPISKNDLYQLNNKERQEANLNTLSYSLTLEKSATAKAQDMLANNYFSHDSPQGDRWQDFFLENGYDYLYAGENLAIDFNTSQSVHNGWMNSETHKDNILNSKFTEMGIGIASGKFNGSLTTIIVVHFGKAFRKTSGDSQVAGASTSGLTNTAVPQQKFSFQTRAGIINIAYLLLAIGISSYLIFKIVVSYRQQKKLLLKEKIKPLSLLLIIVVFLLI